MMIANFIVIVTYIGMTMILIEKQRKLIDRYTKLCNDYQEICKKWSQLCGKYSEKLTEAGHINDQLGELAITLERRLRKGYE